MKNLLVLNFFILLSIGHLKSQVFLQLERSESLKVHKFYAGDELRYKTEDIDRWQKAIIMQVIPDGNSLLFEDQLLSIDEISHIKLHRPTAEVLGKSFMLFGGSWLVMGGLIEGLNAAGAIETNFSFGWDTVGIGASGLVFGFIMDRFLSNDIRRINNTNRLRILDITF